MFLLHAVLIIGFIIIFLLIIIPAMVIDVIRSYGIRRILFYVFIEFLIMLAMIPGAFKGVFGWD